MRCPTLTELPPPPPGKTDWPWTEESEQLPDTMPDGAPWPRVSIVTPSYNQAQFIEETIRSVLLQGYPDLEYIIIDGGSTDGSVEIIRKYEPWLAYWVSERDKGQSHAINKGFVKAGGGIVAWINSDDTYTPQAIAQAVPYLMSDPKLAVVYGNCDVINAQSECIGQYEAGEFSLMTQLTDNLIPQPATFINKYALEGAGYLDESLHYALDYDLWLRLSEHYTLRYVSETWASYRLWEESKTTIAPLEFRLENIKILDKLFQWPGLIAEVQAHKAYAYAYHHLIAGALCTHLDERKQAQQHLQQALQWHPEIIQQEALILSQVLSMKLIQAEWFLSNLLDLAKNPRFTLFNSLLSRCYVEEAFRGYQRADYRLYRKYIRRAIWYYPKSLHNRGLISIYLKTLLPR